jgi:hypothetical protein
VAGVGVPSTTAAWSHFGRIPFPSCPGEDRRVESWGLPSSQDLGPQDLGPQWKNPALSLPRPGRGYLPFVLSPKQKPPQQEPHGPGLPASYIGENCPLLHEVGEGGVVLAPMLESARICESSEVMQNRRTPVLL